MRQLIPLFAVLFSGCASKIPVFSSFDGRPVNPVAQDQAVTECRAKAQVASAQVPHGFGSGASLTRSIEQAQVENKFIEGCLAEKGIKVQWIEQKST